MNWFKWLWCKDLKIVADTNLSYEAGQFPITEEVEKDICEPVWAIIECMKKYPSRWKVHKVDVMNYTVTDIKTSEVFLVGKISVADEVRAMKLGRSTGSGYYIKDRKWLTLDEEKLLIKSFKEIEHIKMDRIKSIGAVAYNKDRSRLMEIYK